MDMVMDLIAAVAAVVMILVGGYSIVSIFFDDLT
jgi:hypothetical protein